MAGATAKLADNKTSDNLWFLSIVSAGISLVANIITGSDGITEKEKQSINKSYIVFIKALGTDLVKKIFDSAFEKQTAKAFTEEITPELVNGIVTKGFFQNAAKTFTKAFGFLMTFATGILDGYDRYKANFEKYTAGSIPENIAKHDAFIDALAIFTKDTSSTLSWGIDNVIFNGVKWGLSVFGINYAENADNYVEAITNSFKTLNTYKNSGTRPKMTNSFSA